MTQPIITQEQLTMLSRAIADLPQYPTGEQLDAIHYGVGANVLTHAEYFAAKNADDGILPDKSAILFTSVLKAWRNKIGDQS